MRLQRRNGYLEKGACYMTLNEVLHGCEMKPYMTVK